MSGGEQMLLKLHMTVVESLIVTTDNKCLRYTCCVFQFRPTKASAKGVQRPPQQRNHRGGVEMQGRKGTTTGKGGGGRGGGYHGVGGRGGGVGVG